MKYITAAWMNAGPELTVVSVVFLLGMVWGALGMRLFGNPRRGWE